MKSILAALFIICSVYSYSQKSGSMDINVEGKTYTLKVGDTLHIGYGSLINGNFMYIATGAGANETCLNKRYAGKYVIITKIKYYKSVDQYWVFVKGKGIFHRVVMPQAIEKKEIVGINSIRFLKE
ncbi:MAG: hypothetical protein IT243_02580 [Bacteroidia bacterium]|nr:hypothetical protein [Bacteroidia bacterium]